MSSYHHTCEGCGCPGVEHGLKYCGSCNVLLEGIDAPKPVAMPNPDEDARASLATIQQAENTRLERIWLANRLSLVLRWNEFPASPVVHR